jgi:hypothetical protein
MRRASLILALALVGCPDGPALQSPDGSVPGDAAFSSGLGEICGNGVDDDGDGAVDCRDPECAAPPLEVGTSFVDANRYLIAGSPACPGALQTGVEPMPSV